VETEENTLTKALQQSKVECGTFLQTRMDKGYFECRPIGCGDSDQIPKRFHGSNFD
jgi:hypothetical protein